MADVDGTLAAMGAVPVEAITPAGLDERLSGARTPFTVRGLAANWPLVRHGRESASDASRYLVDHARDRKFTVSVGEPGAGERLFYDSAMGLNFRVAQGPLGALLDGILVNAAKADAPAVYLASVDMHAFFDGLAEANGLPLGNRQPLESIWIGSKTRVAAHNDVPDNLAVCAVGRRRFTLFPPDQHRNLYVGPLEHTPAGRPVSMVDFHRPDLVAHPRFRVALETAQVAELEPGDALFIPSLWWHHVEALAPFNILVNYWWREVSSFLGKPEDALYHAILAIRDLPEADRAKWSDLFDHYVFASGPDVISHIPEENRGILDRLTPETAEQIRNFLLRSLSR